MTDLELCLAVSKLMGIEVIFYYHVGAGSEPSDLATMRTRQGKIYDPIHDAEQNLAVLFNLSKQGDEVIFGQITVNKKVEAYIYFGTHYIYCEPTIEAQMRAIVELAVNVGKEIYK